MVWQLLILLVSVGVLSSFLGVWLSNIEDNMYMKEKKTIHIYYINKIKNLSYKIFEQEDEDYPNQIVIRSCERWKNHWLDKANITDKKLREEILHTCVWSNDNCTKDLEQLGWTILNDDVQ